MAAHCAQQFHTHTSRVTVQTTNKESTRSPRQQSSSTQVLPAAQWLASAAIYSSGWLCVWLPFSPAGKGYQPAACFWADSRRSVQTFRQKKIQTGASIWLGIIASDTWLFLHSAQSHPSSAHLLPPLCSHPMTFARSTSCWVTRWSTDSYRGNFMFRMESGTCTNTNQNRLNHPRMTQKYFRRKTWLSSYLWSN